MELYPSNQRNALSTQSTNAPEVVNGIRDSIYTGDFRPLFNLVAVEAGSKLVLPHPLLASQACLFYEEVY